VEEAIRNVCRNDEIRTADSGLTNLTCRQRKHRARPNEIAKYTFARYANSAEFLDSEAITAIRLHNAWSHNCKLSTSNDVETKSTRGFNFCHLLPQVRCNDFICLKCLVLE